jgi:predicted AAA+ superfamily ATPase
LKLKKPDWIVIDEVQKLPKLLDLVHLHIEKHKQKFALSGSSARKLKRGGANLLAGRATMNHLHPFSSTELKNDFDLNTSLAWGLLPQIQSYQNDQDKFDFLESYCLTYIKEEIVSEQIVRSLDPFRDFLPIAAQMSGKPLNFSKIARDIEVDTTTVQNYFSILEDTLLGFSISSHHNSIRKRQRKAPKFYFFDTGVLRALWGVLDQPINESTSLYGLYFEHFLILEIKKLSDYKKIRWNFSYLLTKDDVEIDLILEKPNTPTLLIEIKSTKNIQEEDLSSSIKLSKDFKNSKAYCFSRDSQEKKFQHVHCLHWEKGLKELGLL